MHTINKQKNNESQSHESQSHALHNHGHHHHGETKGKRLFVTILLNLMITVAQVIGGLLSGSLSLLSDAAHNFSDVIALLISWIAAKLSTKEFTDKQTFGYKRAEVLAALINVVTILVIAFNILIEGIQRFGKPVEVAGTTVMLLAGLSIVVNGLSVLIIKKDAENSMNMKSAYLHLFSDMLTSIAVLVAGFIMYQFNIYWIDGVIAIAIAAYLIKTSLGLLLETLKVLMQFTPEHINLEEIRHNIEAMKGIKDIHHVHIWQLVDDDIHFEAHITLEEDLKLSEVSKQLEEIKAMAQKYGIKHCTFEPEYLRCNDAYIVDERS